MIQPADVERVKEAIGTKRKNVSSVIGRHDRTYQTGQGGHLDDSTHALIDELRSQNEFLKGQVDSEKTTNAKLLEQMNQGQQLMLAMQTETMRLRQENQKLLLDHQSIAKTTEESKSFEEISKDVEEEKNHVDPVIAAAETRSSRFGWVALSIGVVTMLGWLLLQQSPDVQLKLTELVR